MSRRHTERWEHSRGEKFGRLAVTALIVFVLLLFNSLPLKIGGFGEIRPAFLMAAVFYWAVFRPHMLPPLGAFAAGILVDLLGDFPIGMNALLFIGVQMLVRAQRKFLLAQNFMVIWFSFTLVAFSAAILQWLCYSLFNLHLISVKPILIGACMTVLAYPLTAGGLYTLHRFQDRRPSAHL